MSAYSPASEVILRHPDEFIRSKVLFAGDLQDDLPLRFEANEVKVHCTQYHHWRRFKNQLGENAQFGLLPTKTLTDGCDTLIYYWPKSKQEAQFQLQSLFSLLSVGCRVFIVGENRSGVRSAEDVFAPFGAVHKIDSARRCGLYYGLLDTQANFDPQAWWQEYRLNDITIKALPGVFSRDGLDLGSELLLSVLEQIPQKGEVLDIGCGSGVLSAVLKMRYPDVNLTLTDVNSAALESSKATLEANNLPGKVLASDVFSDVEGRFDAIISNPPFHDGMQTSLNAAESLIRNAKSHLQLGGRLYIVANAFLPYAEMLQQAFGSHEVLAQTGRFKVYQAVFQRPTFAKPDKKRSGKKR